MKLKLLTVSILLLSNGISARPVSSGDVLGRDMVIPLPGVGRIGHLALATGDNIFHPTDLTIEMEPNFNESIMWGTVKGFKSKSRYWGSRSGLITNASFMYLALHNAKLQSFWCPEYTATTYWNIGEGWFDAVQKPHPTKCGKFRCDTFVGYVMGVGGAPQVMNNKIQLPYNAFMTFPVDNGSLIADKPINDTPIDDIDKEVKFLAATVADLNKMSLEEFSLFAGFDPANTPPNIIEKQWSLIADNGLKDGLKWILIDLRSMSKVEDTPVKLITSYDKTTSAFVKTRLTAGIMSFYQNNWDEIQSNQNHESIKRFFAKALLQEKPEKEISAYIVRGFVDLHNESEVDNNLSLIDKHLSKVDKKPLIGLQFELIRKSPELQKKFLPESIAVLRKANDAELDSKFFYYLNNGVEIVKDEGIRKIVRNFILDKNVSYAAKTFSGDKTISEFHAKGARKDMDELMAKLK
ncbi:MAG TPA: hypothetical protein VNU45_07110 [Rummeliibacillus sp.]|nr:hypothetical protein [Rummeliibacillus sp.]